MAEAFTAAWLALREPVDHRSRPAALLTPLDRWLRERGSASVLDLGCGTGSNLRYLAPRVSSRQRWTLLDRDPALLARAGRGAPPAGVVSVACVQGELAREGIDRVAGTDLVTASALLDLVSGAWLDQLVAACQAAGCAALFALTWDGRAAWGGPHPSDQEDALVLALVRSHQRRDKGLGAALGPAAGAAATRAFREAGYRTWLLPSPWHLDHGDARLASALVDGWEHVAMEQSPAHPERVRTWADRRRRAARAAALSLEVGHMDLLALPGEGN